MYALIGLVAFVALIELIAIFGWGTDSRDGRDWNVPRISGRSDRARHTPTTLGQR
jgi:hypothetical protein